MNRTRTATFCATATLALLLAHGTRAGAADPAPGNPPPPSKEQRETMAKAHETMAACLRSDRPFADCRQDMMQTCRDTMGGQGCGMMMGPGGPRGRGMGRGRAGTTGTTQP